MLCFTCGWWWWGGVYCSVALKWRREPTAATSFTGSSPIALKLQHFAVLLWIIYVYIHVYIYLIWDVSHISSVEGAEPVADSTYTRWCPLKPADPSWCPLTPSEACGPLLRDVPRWWCRHTRHFFFHVFCFWGGGGADCRSCGASGGPGRREAVTKSLEQEASRRAIQAVQHQAKHDLCPGSWKTKIL